ncbi:Fatty acyl-CoA reductase 3 [Nymphaea thermarum]|nr:Fatty acyl-CoA reductase 3 [Nymphaea thermarum]
MATLNSIAQSLENKSILITGSTGFLAKIFVEKILRVQPQVKRLYLLVRASDAKSAKRRLDAQVIGKELFRVLRTEHGDEFDSFISEKICPIAGDMAVEDLGIQETHLKQEMMEELDIVANVAATTTFDERYDVALNINALGADRVMAFAHRCHKLQMFLHVSTAYVCGSKSGMMMEKPIRMGETPNGQNNLDIEAKLRLAEKELKELRARGVEKTEEIAAMKELGFKRARSFGWPNFYAFTKAMGEMLIGESRKNLPLVIIRPTIIESTLVDPFPGWIEGFRTAGSVILSYGMGKLKCFPSNVNLPIDVIPADMVVNAMVVSMVAHSRQPQSFIYHVGSSKQNPTTSSLLADCAYRYFSNNPVKGKDGRDISVEKLFVYSSLDDFRKLANFALFNVWGRLHRDLTRRYNFVMYLAELYDPYVFFDGRFDDGNAEGLRMVMKASGMKEAELFNFDPKCINWEEYCMKVYYPGLVRYAMSLKNKGILITGCTGFLAKSNRNNLFFLSLSLKYSYALEVYVFVEKILRVQPQVKRLYLLLRASDAKSAKHRLDTQVISKELFRVLRDMHGDGFDSFISEKIRPIAGDMAVEDLGIQEFHLKEEIMKEVDIIANVAATTTFDERYDIALDINALGADRVMDFAHRCHKLQMFLHVSTAYVCGSKSGAMLEKPIRMGETPNGQNNLDIEAELRLVKKELKELRARGVEKTEETAAMKELGLKRARSFGWPNSYAFTKAMGEMLIGESKRDMPLVIIRPTIIEATLADPFPGWIEGFRTAGSIIMSYGKGRLKCFPGNVNLPLDVIPADMVVNAMVVSMVAHSRQSASFIYHVGTSKQNPVRTSIIADCAYRYFSRSPLKGKDGKAISVNLAQIQKIVFILAVNFYSEKTLLITLPFRMIFDDSNAEGLRMAMKAGGVEQAGLFDFDPKCINWEEYCMKVYYPGLVRYVMMQK